MSEPRFSAWQVILLIVGVLILCSLSSAAGLFVGFQWGQASGLAGAFFQAQQPIPFIQAGPELPGLEAPIQIPGGNTYLGVSYEMLTPDLAEEERLAVDQGALVRSVEPRSPAAEAGLRVGDVIVQVDRQTVDEDHDLRARILEHQPGEVVRLRVLRDGETLNVRVTLISR